MNFILWDRKEGPTPPRNQDTGEILTSGCMGVIALDNLYVRTYVIYPEGSKPLKNLEIGESIRGVKFSLSGSTGYYNIYRIA